MTMLTISRNENQTFTIGDDITATVRRAQFGQARISIGAPKDVPICKDDMKVLKERSRERI